MGMSRGRGEGDARSSRRFIHTQSGHRVVSAARSAGSERIGTGERSWVRLRRLRLFKALLSQSYPVARPPSRLSCPECLPNTLLSLLRDRRHAEFRWPFGALPSLPSSVPPEGGRSLQRTLDVTLSSVSMPWSSPHTSPSYDGLADVGRGTARDHFPGTEFVWRRRVTAPLLWVALFRLPMGVQEGFVRIRSGFRFRTIPSGHPRCQMSQRPCTTRVRRV